MYYICTVELCSAQAVWPTCQAGWGLVLAVNAVTLALLPHSPMSNCCCSCSCCCCCGSSSSSATITTTYLTCGVPQGLVIGPILFVLYAVDLLSVIDNHGLSPHMYTDDTQVYGSCKPTTVPAFTAKISECVQAATSWMRSNRLQPNPDKTEVLWCATTRRQHQLPTTPLLIDGCTVTPVSTYVTSAFTSIPICRCGRRLSTWCRGALPRYEGYVRVVDVYRQPLFR